MCKHLRPRRGRYIFLRTTNAPLLAGTLLSFLILLLKIKIKIIHDLKKKKETASVHSLDPIKWPWINGTRFQPCLPLTPHSLAIPFVELNHRTDWFAGWWDRAKDGIPIKKCVNVLWKFISNNEGSSLGFVSWQPDSFHWLNSFEKVTWKRV